MTPDDSDKRRFYVAALLTLAALPVLWFVSRDDAGAGPTVATAGVDVGGATDPNDTTTSAPTSSVSVTIGQSNLPDEPSVRDDAPIFLDGPAANEGGVSQIAVPASSGIAPIFTEATFRSAMAGEENCFTSGIPTGTTITVVNLDNNKSITCVVALAPAVQRDGLVMHTDRFRELADLTDAPVPVEIRQ